MARNYPRFLFSNPKNTKSEGPFLVRNIFPKMLCKVDVLKNSSRGGGYTLQIIETWDNASEEEYKEALNIAVKWMDAQIKNGDIQLR